jgi:hypothetical protein
LVCPECSAFYATRLGATGWGRDGTLLDENGRELIEPATELVLLGMWGPNGEDLAKVVEEPNPRAGQPVTFGRTYHSPRHQVGRGRPIEQPDGVLLSGVRRQLLAWLDHLRECAPNGQWVAHVQRHSLQLQDGSEVGGHTTRAKWLKELARQASQQYLYGIDGQPKYQRDLPDVALRIDRRRYWRRDRAAIARRLLAAILGEDDDAVRGRLNRREKQSRDQKTQSR